MTHSMRLQDSPFHMIASGKKTFELRLYDEKRRAISVGDEIEFSLISEPTRRLLCKVTSLGVYPSFAEMYAELPLTKCGYTEDDVASASPRDMELYYSPEEQAKYGTLAIGVEVISRS